MGRNGRYKTSLRRPEGFVEAARITGGQVSAPRETDPNLPKTLGDFALRNCNPLYYNQNAREDRITFHEGTIGPFF
jgi:hypothetical protein